MSDGSVLTFRRSAPDIRKILLYPYENWDPQKKYKLPVILMSFSDCDFMAEHDLQFYKDLFNKQGFNLRHGAGCVADYFRHQSQGMFNVEFDIVGPIKLDSRQKSQSKNNLGMGQIKQAIIQSADDFDYSNYDWDNDGKAEVVIVVYAGYGGNELSDAAEGCITPNSDILYGNVTIDGMVIDKFSASAEMWTNNKSCGIGSICHEFSHILGLPDLYPVGNKVEFSVVDEWDLMDGGNYADDGWCPPNYSIFERAYVGWASPEELKTSCTVTDMPSFDSSGKAYKITNGNNPSEYYLLENRQWEGWDYMLPNHGLLITHVNFAQSSWISNRVNSSQHRYEYLHADGVDFSGYAYLYGTVHQYGQDGRSNLLKNTSYPYTDAEGVTHSIPKLFGNTISEVSEYEGLLSFRFMDAADGISSVTDDGTPVAYYDLQGRRINEPDKGIYIVKYSNGSTTKIMR